MATKIVTKNSSTASAVPTASDLVQGELAVNVADKRLFTEDNGGSIVELGTNPSTIDINAGTIDGAVIGGTTPAAITGSTVTSTGNIVVTGTVDGRDVATDGTKLDGIEANADVTDTTNVTAAGALMDSEVTNLAQVKAFDSADYATAAQGATADAALPLAGGALTGAVTTNSTFDGRDVATDGTKLDGIEVGATADQTAAEIKTAYESNADTNAFTDADHTKLDGIEASADVTDTANVTAAGALMDSELTSEASVKALNQGVATTDSPAFAGLTVDTTTLAVDSTNNRVGIGTSSPSSPLTIQNDGSGIVDSLEFANGTGDGNYVKGKKALTLSADYDNNSSAGQSFISFDTDGSERMRIDSSGMLGIGTSSPSAPLQIQADSGELLRLAVNTDSGTQQTFGLGFATGANTHPAASINALEFDASDSRASLLFSTRGVNSDSAATERMRIDSSGNVGIGTTSPAQALTVNGTDARIYLTGANTDIDMDASANGQLFLDGNAYGFGIALNGTGAHLYTNSASRSVIFGVNETEVARVASTNYSVGTTTAATALGTSTSSSDTGVSMSTTGRLSVANSNSYPLALNRYTSEGSLIQLNEAGVTRGAIGIKTNEVYIADSVAGLRMSGNGTNNVIPCTSAGVGTDDVTDLGASGNQFDNIYYSGAINGSDRNIKQDIEELSEAELRVATACKGLIRKYRFIKRVQEKGDNARIHVGIIAQELRDAFTAEGLDAGRYSMFVSNTWWETNEEVAAVEAADAVYETQTDEEGNETQVLISEAVEAQEAYIDRIIYDTAEEAPEGATEVTKLAVNYTELLAFIIAAL